MTVTIPAVTQALTTLEDIGMLKQARDPQQQAQTWARLIRKDVDDRLLIDAIHALASGDIETYGSVKPDDVNRAAKQVRTQRVKAWLHRNEIPTGRRNGFEQSAYARGFLRAIGNGDDIVEADRHGLAAVTVAKQVSLMEPETPLPELLERLDEAIAEGKQPWGNRLPPARPVAEIEAPKTSTGEGRKQAQEVIALLASKQNTPRKGSDSPVSGRTGA